MSILYATDLNVVATNWFCPGGIVHLGRGRNHYMGSSVDWLCQEFGGTEYFVNKFFKINSSNEIYLIQGHI